MNDVDGRHGKSFLSSSVHPLLVLRSLSTLATASFSPPLSALPSFLETPPFLLQLPSSPLLPAPSLFELSESLQFSTLSCCWKTVSYVACSSTVNCGCYDGHYDNFSFFKKSIYCSNIILTIFLLLWWPIFFVFWPFYIHPGCQKGHLSKVKLRFQGMELFIVQYKLFQHVYATEAA